MKVGRFWIRSLTKDELCGLNQLAPGPRPKKARHLLSRCGDSREFGPSGEIGACATEVRTKCAGDLELTRFGGRFRYAAFFAAVFTECISSNSIGLW
jgi:hypothetical protein